MHFCLKDIEAMVHIGITHNERGERQLLKFKVEFDFDPSQAIESDDIKDTLDYKIIFDTVKAFAQSGQWNLLETLHHELYQELSTKCSAANNLKLDISKFPWESASVTVS